VPYSGICSTIVGGYVWANETFSVDKQDVIVTNALATIRKNKGIIDDACLFVTDWYACANVLYPCENAGGDTDEGIPLLPCALDCDEWWETCGYEFSTVYLQTSLNGDISESVVTMCVNGTFKDNNGNDLGTPDRFGVRPLPSNEFYPLGYGNAADPSQATLRWPVDTATYYLSNGTGVTTQCYHPFKPPASYSVSLVAQNTTCQAPLRDGVDPLNNNSATCIVPCPFPVFDTASVAAVQTAFIIPGCIGLALCVLVMLDSLWVVFEYTGGFQWRKLRKYVFWSSAGASTNEGEIASGTSQGYRRRPIQATTLYTLAGSVLGIVYFCLGPLPSIMRGSNITCGASTGFPLSYIQNGEADTSDVTCRAQRFSPFILQLVFNLILFTIVKVLEVVSDKYRRLPTNTKYLMNIALHFYCWAVPIVFLIAAAATDKLSDDLRTGLAQYMRQTSVCLLRFEDPSVEIVLIYIPFILTGLMVSALSVHVLLSIRHVQDQVAGTANAKNTETQLAMRLLILRLSGLGLGTFIVLIVLMITTSIFEAQVNAFGPKWVDWFVCVSTTYQCDLDQCDSLITDANAVRPTSTLMSIQLASMSCITMLFGLFFAAQSSARLLKEYLNGQLGEKWRALVLGSSTMGESAVPSFNVAGQRDKRVMGSEVPSSNVIVASRNETTVAAYQEAET